MNLLEQVTWEHKRFQTDLDEFRLWLEAVAERVNTCVGRHCTLSPGRRLSVLQVPTAASPPGGPLRQGSHVAGSELERIS